MTNRMAIALLAMIGLMIAAYMAAYKFGLLGGIMCGTGGCETVQNSKWAVFVGVPVPVIGLLGYGALLVIALLGLQPRFEDERWIAGVLFAGATIGMVFSVYLSWLEQYEIGAWCRWCIGSAIVALLIFAFAVPELARLRHSETAEA